MSHELPSIPSIQLSLTIEEEPKSTSLLPLISNDVSFEVTREALETMIEGLSKIREQLNSMK